MITIQGLSKTYQQGGQSIQALRDINLDVAEGEVFGIIGLSGAGKSTLIRCINLLERPEKGSVTVAGVEMTKLSPRELREARKKIGMIFQHFNLLSSRTVAGNVAFPLEISGLRRSEAAKRVDELLKTVGLADKAGSYPAQLSGGQKQRVGIARALASNPSVLLCDEATSALDPETTKSVLSLLREINQKMGLTIVIITHEMEVIKEICDRVAVIEDGRIVESGSVLEVFTSPKTETARRMIRGVIDMEIPPGLLQRSLAQTSVTRTLLKISFIGESAGQPIISRLIREHNVTANIVFGRIDHIKDTPFGTLVIELSGEPKALSASLDFLCSQGLRYQILSNGGVVDV